MIPKYDEMMLPLLEFLSDGNEHALNEMRRALAEQMKLTDEELRAL